MPPEPELSREAYALLAQANLLRMRGCWQDAIDRCMEVMTLAPNNASAQSLLGDIYDNQGFTDDAVQWYRMALDVQPDSPADRLKLDRLLETKARQVAAVPAAPPSAPLPVRTDAPPASFTSDAVVRWAAAAAGLLVLLVVVVALVQIRAASRAPVHQVNAPPVILPSLTAPKPVPARVALPTRDPKETALLESIENYPPLTSVALMGGARIDVVDVQEDPRAGRLTITFTLPPPGSGQLTRDTILRAALSCAQAAGWTNAATFTLRCVAASASGGTPSLLGIVDMTRAAATGAPSPGALTTDQMAALFTNTWWSSAVPS